MKVKLQRCVSKGKRLSESLQVLMRRWRATFFTHPSEETASSGLLEIELVSEALCGGGGGGERNEGP